MTLFRQSRGGMKSTRKTSPAIGTNDTEVTDQTASTSSEQPNGTSTYYIPARGHSSSSTSSVDSGSSSAVGASSMNACAINGPIGLQGVMNTAHHQAATRGKCRSFHGLNFHIDAEADWPSCIAQRTPHPLQNPCHQLHVRMTRIC